MKKLRRHLFYIVIIIYTAIVIIAVGLVVNGDKYFMTVLERRDVSMAYNFTIETEVIPFLPAHSHDIEDTLGEHGIWVHSDIVEIPEDLWVSGFQMHVQNGSYAVMHHAQLFRLDLPSLFCPGTDIYGNMREIFIVGLDTIQYPHVFPEPYAVFLPKGTPLLLSAMLHNPFPPLGPGETHQDVSVMAAMRVQKSNKDTDHFKAMEYYRLYLEDDPCNANTHGNKLQSFDVPAGTRFFEKNGDVAPDRSDPSVYTFKSSGTIVTIGAHLHPWEGGERVSTFLNNKPFIAFQSFLTEITPWSWFTFRGWPFNRVNKGDMMTITATYSNPSEQVLRGSAMGSVGFYFAPEE